MVVPQGGQTILGTTYLTIIRTTGRLNPSLPTILLHIEGFFTRPMIWSLAGVGSFPKVSVLSRGVCRSPFVVPFSGSMWDCGVEGFRKLNGELWAILLSSYAYRLDPLMELVEELELGRRLERERSSREAFFC